ncbi:MAG: FtsW/RodA/SpoVE family cell cycle protein [Acidobacteria bacterium]|nr:FtsW/RodA/SpoVE family cell cycle protein [Acidobacteriota bacterium]
MINRPSRHLAIQAGLCAAALLAQVAIVLADRIRGFTPSSLVLLRDFFGVLVLLAGFVFLVRRFGYRGELSLFTCVMILYVVGTVAQFRLFTDPEYTSRGEARAAARLAKAHAVRALGVGGEYDDAKLKAILGRVDRNAVGNVASPALEDETSVADIVSSSSTYTPWLAVAALILGFLFVQHDGLLLWVQRNALVLALAAVTPLTLIILLFTRAGKFVGGMTPWEPAKMLFLISLAGILVDQYSLLERSGWRLPRLRFLLPLLIVTLAGLVPFFLLGDFGQLLVFVVVYALVYVIAVRKPAQLLHGVAALLLAFTLITAVGGIPHRVFIRLHLWQDPWKAPPETATWWSGELQRIRAGYGAAGARVSNEDAWYEKGSQLSQALFGISSGGVMGTGLGLGLPETVPVSDSDFIYSTIAEELGLPGGLAVTLPVLLIGLMGTGIAMRARDAFTKLLATGVTSFLVFQAFVNIAGVLKVLPMTGITLPFVSHGGWSLLTSFAMVGMLMGVSHRNRGDRE